MPNPENLIPAKPGEVRNPRGRNQYTYRAEAEKHLEEWCREYGRELVRKICDEARRGKPWAAKLALERILPAITRHDIQASVSGAVEITLESEWDELTRGVSRLRSNGRDVPTEKGNGGADPGATS